MQELNDDNNIREAIIEVNEMVDPINSQSEFYIQDESANQIVEKSRFRKTIHGLNRTAQIGIIAMEVGPGNEAIRFGTFAAAQALSGNPFIGAAALGGSTFIVEGAAALATAELITTDKSTKAIGWINKKLHKFIPEGARMTPIAEAGVAMFGGSVVVLAEKQIEDPTRTASENRKHGIFTAGWMAGVMAVEGGLISEGISNLGDIKKVGVALLGVAAVTSVFKKASSKMGKQKNNDAVVDQNKAS